MQATVYIDLFFMINFSMDFLCLFLCRRLLNLKASIFRGLAAAVFGGLYASLALFFPFGSVTSVIVDILACIILCMIAFFKISEWKRTPLYILVYTAISMVLGGFMTALFNLFNRFSIFDSLKQGDGDGISVWLFALLAIISGGITLLSTGFFKSKTSKRLANVEFTYGKKSICISGFVDTGNLLREPISARPCIIADISELSKILPKEICSLAKSADIFGLEDISAEHKKRVLLIPTATASGSGMLIGVRMDKISIECKGQFYEADAIAALSNIDLSAEGAKALIPSCLLM